MPELTEAERSDVAAAAAAVKRAAAQGLVTAGIKAGTKLRLADVDDACDGDPVDADRLDFKGKLIWLVFCNDRNLSLAAPGRG